MIMLLEGAPSTIEGNDNVLLAALGPLDWELGAARLPVRANLSRSARSGCLGHLHPSPEGESGDASFFERCIYFCMCASNFLGKTV